MKSSRVLKGSCRAARRCAALLLMMLAAAASATAQTRSSVTGIVVDRNNMPIGGVSVTAERGEETTTTDPDGRFEITLDDGDKLAFSASGLETLLLSAKDGMTVTLQPTAASAHTGSYVRFAAGHFQTMLNAQLNLQDNKGNSAVIKADHDARWGFRTLEWSALSADYTHSFGRYEAYAKAGGAHLFFTRYGRYYADAPGSYTIRQRYSALTADDRQAIWRGTATAGMRAQADELLQWKTELTGQAYAFERMMTEYQLNARINIEQHWRGEGTDRKVGANIYAESHIVGLGDSARAIYDSRGYVLTPSYSLRMEPFFAYRGKRMSVHLGVNLDMNIGKGNLFSLTDEHTPLARQVSFAPSPNLRIKGQLADWASVFADVLGSLGTSSITGYVRLNPYLNVLPAPSSHHVSGYTPADARAGFLLKPHADLLLQLDAGYRYVLNSAECCAVANADGLLQWNMMGILYTDFQRWKTGAELTYHYRDLLQLHLSADYYIYRGVKHNTTGAQVGDRGAACYTEGRVYDRPLWEMSARLDVHPDAHWSIYTDNSFKGKRWAITSLGDRPLPAFVELNLGTAYQFADTGNRALDRLELFLELINLLNRHNVVWIGYESTGISGRLGGTYSF